MREGEDEDVRRPVVAMHQPNYAPWIGYFVKMAVADVFVLVDDVQFSKRSWTNRAKVLGPTGPTFLTIPLRHPSFQVIRDVAIADEKWPEAHLRKLRSFYARTPGLSTLKGLYAGVGPEERRSLSAANICLLRRLREVLGVSTRVVLSSGLGISESDPVERIVRICRALGVHTYLSGQGGASYNDPTRLAASGFHLRYVGFEHPTYPQGRADFTAGLSVLDLIASRGSSAGEVLEGVVASCRLTAVPPT